MRRALALLATAHALDKVNPKYWQLQGVDRWANRRLYGRGSTVLEVDAVDGAKNLYYADGMHDHPMAEPPGGREGHRPQNWRPEERQGLETVNARATTAARRRACSPSPSTAV